MKTRYQQDKDAKAEGDDKGCRHMILNQCRGYSGSALWLLSDDAPDSSQQEALLGLPNQPRHFF